MVSRKLITEKQAAELLLIEESTLAKIRRQKIGTPNVPYLRIGNQIRYHDEDLMTWARSQRGKKALSKKHADEIPSEDEVVRLN